MILACLNSSGLAVDGKGLIGLDYQPLFGKGARAPPPFLKWNLRFQIPPAYRGR